MVALDEWQLQVHFSIKLMEKLNFMLPDKLDWQLDIEFGTEE